MSVKKIMKKTNFFFASLVVLGASFLGIEKGKDLRPGNVVNTASADIVCNPTSTCCSICECTYTQTECDAWVGGGGGNDAGDGI